MKNRVTKMSLLLLWAWIFIGFMAGHITHSQGASQPKTLLKKADTCRKSLYGSSKKRKYRHNWMRCINLYQDIQKHYPKSDESGWALYHSAGMYVKLFQYSNRQQDLDRGIGIYRTLAGEKPDHRLADDAQYRIGEIYYRDKKDLTQAYVEFLKVDIKFPSGDMRPRARAMMDKLSIALKKKEKEPQTDKGFSPSSGGQLTRVKDIRHWSTPTYTRVVIDLEKSVKYETHLLKEDLSLKKPRRLYLDLKDAFVSSKIESSIPIRDGLLQRARAGQYKKNIVRVVLDINSISGHKIFPLHDPFRIVVDVRGKETKSKKIKKAMPKGKERPVGKGIRKVKKPDKTVSLARQLGLNVKKIVIDPGHGGKDPGTYIKGGIKEKNIVLKLAKTLARKVEERLGCEAVLTRSRDVFMPLERRTAFANMNKADLFVSLHINAHKQSGIHGLETYFLNMATDARAVMVAARENATSEKNISDLQTILNDLMLNTKISESSKLAHEIQRGMLGRLRKQYKRVKSLGVKQAPFYVLIGAEMPAILIETGFITNPRERDRLLSQKYLDRLADGIVRGLDRYIKSIDKITLRGG